MNRIETALAYHKKGFNCCQSVFCSLREYTGIAEDKAAALASSFGGGMRCGSICGGVTGALMAIGCACFKGKDPAAEKARSSELTLELEEKFRADITMTRETPHMWEFIADRKIQKVLEIQQKVQDAMG